MNRAVNTFSFILGVVYIALTVAIVYDLSFSTMWTLKGMGYKTEILGGLAVVILLLGLIRVRRRWQGIRDMKRFDKFTFDCLISKDALNYSIMFTVLEIAFMLALMVTCIIMSELHPEYTLPMIVVMAILVTESIVFMSRVIKGGSAFKLGVNKDVLAYFNREMHLIYYSGLQRVEIIRSDEINFKFKEELNMVLPTSLIRKEDRKEFREALIATLDDKNVYIDDAFRAWE